MRTAWYCGFLFLTKTIDALFRINLKKVFPPSNLPRPSGGPCRCEGYSSSLGRRLDSLEEQDSGRKTLDVQEWPCESRNFIGGSQMKITANLGPLAAILMLSAMSVVTGCSYLRGDGPLDTLVYPARDGDQTEGLIVFLRGRGGSHQSFSRAGWVDAVRSHGMNFTVVAPNTHFGYYRERTLVGRLRDEVVAPVCCEDQQELWLVGVSMGGLGALLYLREESEDVSGVVLISPFLGSENLTAEIEAAGGLRAWDPGEPREDEWDRDLWLWLKVFSAEPGTPPLILAFGEEDRYEASHRLLAAVLPPERVITKPGGHHNRVFTELWLAVLDRGLLGDN